MKPQALAHNTPVYCHNGWICVFYDEVQSAHAGNEFTVCLQEVGFVPWAQVFISEEEAKEDLRRTSKCKESETK